ncbi:MAG: DUF1540 domain-containing protein [Clostridia bacterium]|nr:DUF1540 domain-containing protein [Clostridia bacterium]
MKKEIKEIKCNAHNCVYNEDGCKCVAGHIEVGPSSACTCAETICATFEPNSNVSK